MVTFSSSMIRLTPKIPPATLRQLAQWQIWPRRCDPHRLSSLTLTWTALHRHVPSMLVLLWLKLFFCLSLVLIFLVWILIPGDGRRKRGSGLPNTSEVSFSIEGSGGDLVWGCWSRFRLHTVREGSWTVGLSPVLELFRLAMSDNHKDGGGTWVPQRGS